MPHDIRYVKGFTHTGIRELRSEKSHFDVRKVPQSLKKIIIGTESNYGKIWAVDRTLRCSSKILLY